MSNWGSIFLYLTFNPNPFRGVFFYVKCNPTNLIILSYECYHVSKYKPNGNKIMYLKNVNSALLFISMFIPYTVFAATEIQNSFGVDDLMNDWLLILFLAIFALAGGIASNFIKTDADEFVIKPLFTKTFVGFFLGISVGLLLNKHYNLSVYVLLMPVLIVSSLGSAILVFYMRYFGSPETRKRMAEKLDNLPIFGKGNDKQ